MKKLVLMVTMISTLAATQSALACNNARVDRNAKTTAKTAAAAKQNAKAALGIK